MGFLIIALILIFQPIAATDYLFGGKDSDFKNIQLKGISVIQQKNSKLKLELSKRKSVSSELYLNFENKKISDLKDESRHYTIDGSYYGKEKSDEKILGKTVARFTGKNHFIKIRAEKNTLLGSNLLSEDFYISFFIKPEIFEGNNTLFAKTYFSHGKKYSFNLDIVKNRLNLEISNLFTFKSSETSSVILESNSVLNNQNWTHVVIYFKISDGEIILYENGKETSRTNFPELNGEISQFGIHKNDTTPLVIGKNYYGKLDNFLIAKDSPDFEALTKNYMGIDFDFQNSKAFQKSGKVLSGVLNTKFSNSSFISIEPDWNIPDGTLSDLFIRISSKPFSQNDVEPNWISLDKYREERKTLFQFFQWMLILRSDHSGSQTPVLHSIKFKYNETIPPFSPTGIRIIGQVTSDLKVCLAWDSNKEENVKNGGGYFLHYGLTPERMIGTIRYLNGKKENISKTNLCIDNDLILMNSDNIAEKNLTVFEKGKTYYFKVSAYNNMYEQVKSPDQKSKLSKTISFTFESDPLNSD